jgi:hypothetical protein
MVHEKDIHTTIVPGIALSQGTGGANCTATQDVSCGWFYSGAIVLCCSSLHSLLPYGPRTQAGEHSMHSKITNSFPAEFMVLNTFYGDAMLPLH